MMEEFEIFTWMALTNEHLCCCPALAATEFMTVGVQSPCRTIAFREQQYVRLKKSVQLALNGFIMRSHLLRTIHRYSAYFMEPSSFLKSSSIVYSDRKSTRLNSSHVAISYA